MYDRKCWFIWLSMQTTATNLSLVIQKHLDTLAAWRLVIICYVKMGGITSGHMFCKDHVKYSDTSAQILNPEHIKELEKFYTLYM